MLVKRFEGLGKSFLGNVSYPRDFVMFKQAWGDAMGFKPKGQPDHDISLTVFGEVSACSSLGAGGDHKFLRNDGTVSANSFPSSNAPG